MSRVSERISGLPGTGSSRRRDAAASTRDGWSLFSEFGLSQRPKNSAPKARPHCSLAQRARAPGKEASRAESPKQAVATRLVPGLQPGIAPRQETYGVAIGYSVVAPLALNGYDGCADSKIDEKKMRVKQSEAQALTAYIFIPRGASLCEACCSTRSGTPSAVHPL